MSISNVDNSNPVVHTDGYYSITYYDSDILDILETSIIIDVASINRIVGPLEGFTKLYGLFGFTNGKLFILTCEEPVKLIIKLIEDVLEPEGFEYLEDYVIYWYEVRPTKLQCYRLFDLVSYSYRDAFRAKWIHFLD